MQGAQIQGQGGIFPLSRESMEEFFKICSASYDIWKNHATTVMPALEINLLSRKGLPPQQTLLTLFHLFCATPARHVFVSQKLGAKPALSEYNCQPLAIVLYPDAKASPLLRDGEAVLAERTGTSDEISFAFVSCILTLGLEGNFTLLLLRKDGERHHSLVVEQDGVQYFIDLSSGIFFQQEDDFISLAISSGGKPKGLLSGLLAAFGGSKRPASGADLTIEQIYRACQVEGGWNIGGVFCGDAALKFYWHYQCARRLAAPYLSGDLFEMSEQSPAGFAKVRAMSGSDFSQVKSHLASAVECYGKIPSDFAHPVESFAERARNALALLEKV